MAQDALKVESFSTSHDVRIEPRFLGSESVDRITIDDVVLTSVRHTPLAQTLPQTIQNEIQNARREVVSASLKAVLSGKLSGPMMIRGDRGVVLTFTDVFKKSQGITEANPLEEVRKNKSKLKKFAEMANEAVITSTMHAAKNYETASHEMDGRVVEAGLSLNFKIELQLGIGGLNLSKCGAAKFEIGYNHAKRQIVFHYGWRTEKQAGGISTPSIKFEPRIYQMIDLEEKSNEFTGKAWYPPTPIPGVSFVFDSSGPYRAQGLVIGLTAGDWVGLSLVNTEQEFSEVQKTKVWLTVSKPIDMIMMTVFNAVWGPATATVQILTPPVRAAYKYGKMPIVAVAKGVRQTARSCQAVISGLKH
ncbi:MAG: hypothetical protein V4692_16585 [Bdellovibrionota bacterium]